MKNPHEEIEKMTIKPFLIFSFIISAIFILIASCIPIQECKSYVILIVIGIMFTMISILLFGYWRISKIMTKKYVNQKK